LSDGVITVADDGNATFMRSLFIGYQDQGQMTLGANSTASVSEDTTLGYFAGSQGSLRLEHHSSWRTDGDLVVGRNGQGDLAITAGAQAYCQTSTMGASSKSTGSAVVVGDQSQWIAAKRLAVGEYGAGQLTVSAGGAVEVGGDVDIGRRPGSTGNVTIAGVSSKLTARRISAASEGHAALRILEGGFVEVQKGMIGDLPGGEGTAIVSGAKWSCANSLDIGGSLPRGVGGKATLVLQDQAAVDVAGPLRIWNQGVLRVDGGSLHAGALDLKRGSTIVFRSGTLSIAGHAHLDGSLRIELPQGIDLTSGPTLPILTYGSQKGSFATVEGPPGVQLEPVYSDTGVQVVIKRGD
jgi:T5SS/PEP-CTERM-associated repeat protein